MGKDFLVMMLEETHHTFLDWIVLYQKVTTLIQSLTDFFFLVSADLLTWILVTFTLQSIILFILFILAVLYNMWGLSFLTRAQIQTPCIGNLEY